MVLTLFAFCVASLLLACRCFLVFTLSIVLVYGGLCLPFRLAFFINLQRVVVGPDGPITARYRFMWNAYWDFDQLIGVEEAGYFAFLWLVAVSFYFLLVSLVGYVL